MAFTDPGSEPGTAASVSRIGLGSLFYILLFFPAFIVAGLGDCAPGPCPPNHSIRDSMLLALGPALLLGLALRSLFHWLAGKIRAREPEAAPYAGPTPWWAIAALPLAAFEGWWQVWGWWS
jgi:hypothetical protein